MVEEPESLVAVTHTHTHTNNPLMECLIRLF